MLKSCLQVCRHTLGTCCRTMALLSCFATCRNLSSLHWISTAGVCGFIYTAFAIVYESSKVQRS